MPITHPTTDLAELSVEAPRPDTRLDRLAVASRDGDSSAFAELYEASAPSVYRYCLSRTRNAADAEDLLQQTFLRVVEALPRYEDRGLPFEAWLFRICRSVTIDAHRRRRPQQPLDPAELASAEAPPAGPADDLLAEVFEALEALTPDQRQVIELRFFADLTMRDIGLVMGRDEVAVRAMQSRAIAALRRRLGVAAPRLLTAAAVA